MAKKPVTKGQLRPASAMDSVNIVRLLKLQHAESAARLLGEFDEQRVLQYVTATLANPQAYSIVVEFSGRILGSAAIAPIPIVFSRGLVMAEAWFAVVAACREQEVPGQMLDAIATLADSVPVHLILGTNVLAPVDFDDILSARADLTIGRSSYVRVPRIAKKEAAA